MKNLNFLPLALTLAIGLFACAPGTDNGRDAASGTAQFAVHTGDSSLNINGFTISPPHTGGNLQVFLISGKEDLKGKMYTTLSTAMDSQLVVVDETGNVGELRISNASNEYVFIHSGDIVKGGKQDRTIAFDVIIPPHAKNVDLQSFCVEQGRWEQREGEDVAAFGSNTKMLSSRELKLAAKYDTDQSKVWSKVQAQQEKLKENFSDKKGEEVEVRSEVSGSSLQLTLENEEVQKEQAKIEKQMIKMLEENPDAIGYAYAINGEIMGVDIYNNRQLFEEIWPKLIGSIVVESLSAELMDDHPLATTTQVVEFINAVELAEVNENTKKVNAATDLLTAETKGEGVSFSTLDKDRKSWVHKNYMKKDTGMADMPVREEMYQLNNYDD